MTAISTKPTKRAFDVRAYKRLLGRVIPRPIQSEKELNRIQAEVDKLTSKSEDRLSREETELLEMLSILIEQYEDIHHPIPEAPGYAVLKMLMDERELRQSDLLPVFGNRAAASRVLNGSRAISKTQAKKLAEFFRVPADLFI